MLTTDKIQEIYFIPQRGQLFKTYNPMTNTK